MVWEMRLKAITYKEWADSPQEWSLEKLSFGQRMLIVGRNASGKSRSLNLTASLARNIAGFQPVGLTGEYMAVFDDDGSEYTYQFKCNNSVVINEKITITEEDYLTRNDDGTGMIFAEKIGEKGLDIPFQVPSNMLAVSVKRDSIQHPFIDKLHKWANSLRHYRFGGIEQNALTLMNQPSLIDEKDQNAVTAIFNEGLKRFGGEFVDSIKKDLFEVDYHVDDINISTPITIRIDPNGPPIGSINVKEQDLNGITDQLGMSTGMFRVLAILVHVNFAQFNGSASSVLIDDIGEGLDFDRSCRLINLLREKSIEHGFQLVMTTNDKFVMNNVPLDEWTVLHRTGGAVHVRNYENSKEIFDDFKFTGLSNFSFFEINAVDMNHEPFCED